MREGKPAYWARHSPVETLDAAAALTRRALAAAREMGLEWAFRRMFDDVWPRYELYVEEGRAVCESFLN